MYKTIRNLCESRGITVYRMCKESGVKQNTISNLKKRPSAGLSFETAIKLSQYFDVPIETFKRGD